MPLPAVHAAFRIGAGVDARHSTALGLQLSPPKPRSDDTQRHGRMVTFGNAHERTSSGDDGVDHPTSGMSRSSSSSNLPHKRLDSAWSPITPAETRCPSPACGIQLRVTVVDTDAEAAQSTPLMTPDPSPLIVAPFRFGRAASVQDHSQYLPAPTCTTRAVDRTDGNDEALTLPPAPKLGNVLTLNEMTLHSDPEPFPWSLVTPRSRSCGEFDADYSSVAAPLPPAPKVGETLALNAAILSAHPPEPFPWALLAPRRARRGAEPADSARVNCRGHGHARHGGRGGGGGGGGEG
ncbi:hypothetical protein AMAG_14716 [Allomyces macrogynus ATCC 38327]|uniref:Uncharacterized protein n=1 Tax=Allomyces macrogynus (strain ATCC 38327) TaxID=578462 RepID=A0A0L0T5L6_ALLM3|nr:hypothetical protein AMAG_14716 [Allomyces macrogynus ATCC 38327]|eukprot:KNE69869.1 hypothetical protein AMAG_14716 [Allomyces macrogynus ATCC 38327]